MEPLADRTPEHVPVLADPDRLLYDPYKGVDIVRAARPLPALVDAFRSGGAPPPLSWEPEGRAEFNRAIYLNLLGTEWLPAIPDVDRRLRAEPPARVADVPAAPAGRASRWLVRIPRSRCTGSTSTRT